MKIGILVREETMMKCNGSGCLKALNARKDAFARYNDEVELLMFTHIGGELDYKIEKMIKSGIEAVHLSSCLRAKSTEYEALARRLSAHFDVIGYTHGSEVGKTREAIIISKENKI